MKIHWILENLIVTCRPDLVHLMLYNEISLYLRAEYGYRARRWWRTTSSRILNVQDLIELCLIGIETNFTEH